MKIEQNVSNGSRYNANTLIETQILESYISQFCCWKLRAIFGAHFGSHLWRAGEREDNNCKDTIQNAGEFDSHSIRRHPIHDGPAEIHPQGICVCVRCLHRHRKKGSGLWLPRGAGCNIPEERLQTKGTGGASPSLREPDYGVSCMRPGSCLWA